MKVFNKFPLVRLKQFCDNPRYIIHYCKRLFYYKYVSHKYIPYYKNIKFLSAKETLDYLIDNNASLARFSDGDIEQLTGAGEYPPDSDWTQRSSKKLINRLEEILFSNNKKLLIAHESPSVFCLKKDEAEKKGVIYNMWTDTRLVLHKYLSQNKVYGHAHVFIAAHHPEFNWQKLYDYLKDRDVIIVTGGTSSLFGVSLGRRMFYVEAGKHDAFERYDEIKSSLLNLIDAEGLKKDDTLIMASLGPTADILAYDLTKDGWQVWDTGHFFKYTDKKFLEFTKNEQIFTKQLSDVKNEDVEVLFKKCKTLYEASLNVGNLIMPKPLRFTKTTIIFEKVALPPTFLEMLNQNSSWEKDWFCDIGSAVGALHSELFQKSNVSMNHGDLSIHNIALSDSHVFLFDSMPPILSSAIDKELGNSRYVDIARFIVSLVVGLGFRSGFVRQNKMLFINQFIDSYQNASEYIIEPEALRSALKQELDWWKAWQIQFGYSRLLVYIKYNIAKLFIKMIMRFK